MSRRRNASGLPADAWRVLRALARSSDATLTGRRTYPHNYHFTLHQPAWGHHPASDSDVQGSTISALVESGCIDPTSQARDQLAYEISAVGLASLKRKMLHPMAGKQLDWVTEQAELSRGEGA